MLAVRMFLLQKMTVSGFQLGMVVLMLQYIHAQDVLTGNRRPSFNAISTFFILLFQKETLGFLVWHDSAHATAFTRTRLS